MIPFYILKIEKCMKEGYYNNFLSTEDFSNPGLMGEGQRGCVNCGMSLLSTDSLEFTKCNTHNEQKRS